MNDGCRDRIAVVVMRVAPHQGERESRSQGEGPEVRASFYLVNPLDVSAESQYFLPASGKGSCGDRADAAGKIVSQ